MSRFYSPPQNIKEDRIILKGKEAHHIYKVMRLRVSDEVVVFDGGQKEYTGRIIKAEDKQVVVKIDKIKKVPSGRQINLSLAVGLPKSKKMDLIVQKCTELGVREIIPLKTKRSLISLDEAKTKDRIRRWKEIAKEASKQCQRVKIPEVANLSNYNDIIKKAKDYDYAIMPCFSDEAEDLSTIFKKNKIEPYHNMLILIGPEGGFSQDEIKEAKERGIILASLGERILRTETASIYVCSILNFIFGSKNE